MNLFVSRLRDLLVCSGKMQKDICVELGVSRQKLSKWKTGYNEPSLDELMEIALYFEVSTDYLLGLEDDSGVKSIINNSFNNFTNSGEIKIK
ncbi:MAG: helix-turn-helix transcriptional regulator [Clostridia bacterium]|nr:helix-turn-helix transcriptional regulator [Clostridia bacterium]